MQPDYYEAADTLSEYLLFHYGTDQEVLPWSFGPVDSLNFPSRIANVFSPHYPLHSETSSLRALDIGCAVGRSSFELTCYADEVVGVDSSGVFIATAEKLKANGQIDYDYKIQGQIRRQSIARIPDTLDRRKVSFRQADAMQLDPGDLSTFDILLCSNLICRLNDPARFFQTLPALLKPEGIFVLSSPFSWLTEYTPEACWLGGKSPDQSAFDAIKSCLSEAFLLLETRDLPMLIREHERKFQWTVCHGSVWKKKSHPTPS